MFATQICTYTHDKYLYPKYVTHVHSLTTNNKWATTMSEEESSFFDRERDRLAREITSVSRLWCGAYLIFILVQGFEELLSSTNVLNRKFEEVLGMTKEYDTIASLWHSFYQLMKGSILDGEDDHSPVLPGTGGHVIAMKQSTN